MLAFGCDEWCVMVVVVVTSVEVLAGLLALEIGMLGKRRRNEVDVSAVCSYIPLYSDAMPFRAGATEHTRQLARRITVISRILHESFVLLQASLVHSFDCPLLPSCWYLAALPPIRRND